MKMFSWRGVASSFEMPDGWPSANWNPTRPPERRLKMQNSVQKMTSSNDHDGTNLVFGFPPPPVHPAHLWNGDEDAREGASSPVHACLSPSVGATAHTSPPPPPPIGIPSFFPHLRLTYCVRVRPLKMSWFSPAACVCVEHPQERKWKDWNLHECDIWKGRSWPRLPDSGFFLLLSKGTCVKVLERLSLTHHNPVYG